MTQVVLITGAARGIGAATAKAFLAAGFTVAACDIDTKTGAKTAADMGAHFYRLDVREAGSWRAVVAAIEDEHGPVSVLINNAGIMPVGRFVDESSEMSHRQMEINWKGPLLGIQSILPGMLHRKRGSIVNVASLAGRIPTPYAAVYASTKFALSGLTQSLQYEHHNSGVHFCIVYPSIVQTSLTHGVSAPVFPKPVTPEAVAAAILKGVQQKNPRVNVPRIGAILGLLPRLLPSRLSHKIAAWTGLQEMFLNVNANDRAEYRNKIR